MIFSDKTYDIIKWVALVVLDAVAVLVLNIGREWGLPYYEQISNTIHYVGLFMGALVGISYVQYNKALDNGIYADGKTDEVDDGNN